MTREQRARRYQLFDISVGLMLRAIEDGEVDRAAGQAFWCAHFARQLGLV